MPIESQIAHDLNLKNLNNAFDGKKSDNTLYERITIRLPVTVCRHLKEMYPKTGVYQKLSQTLIIKFLQELERHNVSGFDPISFNKHLEGCSIVFDNVNERPIQRSPSANSPVKPKTPNRNVRR